ncbi:MAG: hypothetical protein IKB50_00725 [Clostridia bacterium]|nr:hypothetical protein [Clostridia bacterium]
MKRIISLMLVIVLAVSLCSCSFNNGAVGAIKKYYQAIIDRDGEALFEVNEDPQRLEDRLDDSVYLNENDIHTAYDRTAKDLCDSYEEDLGEDLSVSVEKKNSTRYNKDDAKKINIYLKEAHGYPANYVTEVVVVTAKITITGSRGRRSHTEEYIVSKIDGKWYVNNLPGVPDKEALERIIKKH